MTKDHEQHLRQNLAYLISGGGAHAKFEDVIKNLPPELRGRKPGKFPAFFVDDSRAHAHCAVGHPGIQPQ